MPTALDGPSDRLNERQKTFVDNVREHGWFRTNVSASEDRPGFSYTTGFWLSAKAPEIIVFALESQIAHEVMWSVYRDLAAGTSFPIAKRLSNVFADIEAVLLPVSKPFYRAYLGGGRWFYGDDDWPCVQLVWPDTNGLFPWEDGYDERFAGSQPNLTGAPWPAI